MPVHESIHHPRIPLPRRSFSLLENNPLPIITSIFPRASINLPLLTAIFAILIINQQPLLRPLHSLRQVPSHPNFPPPLSLHFSHLKRPSSPILPPPRDWRRPSVLTIHARAFSPSGNKKYILTILTTGTDAGWFQRGLKLAGCSIAHQLFPADIVQPEMVACRIPQLPSIGAKITALLAWDSHLQSAISYPHYKAGVSFPILQGDVLKANSTLNNQSVAFVRSEIRWYPTLFDPPQPNPQRYELCLMTQIKHDAHLLLDWLSFYRRMGVDKFYLYDNRAPSDLARFSSEYVEVVYWPWIRAQSQAYSHFLLTSKARCKYSAFFDVDEYAFVGAYHPNVLKTYIEHRAKKGFGQVLFPQLKMNSNGYVKRPKGPIPERYTRVEKYQRGFGVKPVLRTDIPWLSHRINRAWGSKAATYFNLSVIAPKSIDDNGIIVHFLSRSWEEYVAKLREGSTAITGKYYPPALLNKSNPQMWYLSQAHSSDMFEFRSFWRRMMRIKDTGKVVITWDKNDQTCRQAHCPRCLAWSIGKTTCEKR